MSSEHVEVLREMKGWRMPPIGGSAYNAALDAAIAALSAPQPPAEAQPVAEVELRHMVAKLAAHVRPTCGELWAEAERLLNRTAPPSAPVGVEAIAAEIRASLGRDATVSTRRRWAIELEALAQQPAAVECDCPAGRIDHASWCAVSKAQDAALAAQQQGGRDHG